MVDKCLCEGMDRFIFSCAGASDVGELAYNTARKLSKDDKGKMFCLAGISAQVPGMIESTKSA